MLSHGRPLRAAARHGRAAGHRRGAMREELSPALLRWLEDRLRAIPAGEELRITFRRDRGGKLSPRARVEAAESWEDHEPRAEA